MYSEKHDCVSVMTNQLRAVANQGIREASRYITGTVYRVFYDMLKLKLMSIQVQVIDGGIFC